MTKYDVFRFGLASMIWTMMSYFLLLITGMISPLWEFHLGTFLVVIFFMLAFGKIGDELGGEFERWMFRMRLDINWGDRWPVVERIFLILFSAFTIVIMLFGGILLLTFVVKWRYMAYQESFAMMMMGIVLSLGSMYYLYNISKAWKNSYPINSRY